MKKLNVIMNDRDTISSLNGPHKRFMAHFKVNVCTMCADVIYPQDVQRSFEVTHYRLYSNFGNTLIAVICHTCVETGWLPRDSYEVNGFDYSLLTLVSKYQRKRA